MKEYVLQQFIDAVCHIEETAEFMECGYPTARDYCMGNFEGFAATRRNPELQEFAWQLVELFWAAELEQLNFKQVFPSYE